MKNHRDKSCARCGKLTSSRMTPPMCGRCQRSCTGRTPKFVRGSSERGTATDERIAALAVLAELRLPLAPGRRERDEPRRVAAGTGRDRCRECA